MRRFFLLSALAATLFAQGLSPVRRHKSHVRRWACVEQHYAGSGRLIAPDELEELEAAFLERWGTALPITSDGQDAVHARMGMDHTGRVDVGLPPGSAPGVWLQGWLRERLVPYYAFSRACLGKATGPHIHIGPASEREAHERSGRLRLGNRTTLARSIHNIS